MQLIKEPVFLNSLFEESIANSSHGILIHQNFNVLYANKKAHEHFNGIVKGENICKFHESLLDEDQVKLECFFDRIKNRTSVFESGVFCIKNHHNESIFLNFSIKLLNFDHQILITEIDNVGTKISNIQNSESYRVNLERLLDETPAAMLIINEDGDVEFFNKFFLKLKNVDEADVRGKNINDFLRFSNIDTIFQNLLSSFNNKTDSLSYHSVVMKDGLDYYLRLQIKFIKFHSDAKGVFLVLISDLTDQKNLQDQLDEINKALKNTVDLNVMQLESKTEKLERSQTAMIYLLEDMQDIQKELTVSNQKLTIVNQDLQSFNYSASHDLKAPLRTIYNYGQFLMDEIGSNLNDGQKKMLSEIIKQSGKMSHLLNDLLRFSRAGEMQLIISEINMKELFNAIVSELLSPKQKKVFQIIIDDLPPAKGDYALIKQVVINLISNAIKFSVENENPKIFIGFENQIDKILYFVKDNVIGFNPNLESQIFDLFFRLNNAKDKPGTGVGLAIVKRIIEKHGGTVYSRGQVGLSAEIGFTLMS